MSSLVNFICNTNYEHLSPQLVEEIKKMVIDTIGVAIAGSRAAESKMLARLIKKWGGRREGTIFVYGGMVPAPNAVMVNSTMARALELDGVHHGGGGHLPATFIPAAISLAEYSGKTISGRDLILAIVIGSEVSCRLRCALISYPGWVSETFAPFGIAAMGAKLLNFSNEQLLNAMGLAYSLCSCNLQANVDGSSSVRLQQGLGAKGGILACVLANQGFTGATNVLEGQYGFYSLYAHNEYNPEVITGELGKQFQMADTSIKFYPSCAFTHIPIYATIEIIKEHKIDPNQIIRIIVYTNSKGYSLTGFGDNKYHPRNIIDAQFSIPYTVATAAIRGKVFLEAFEEKSLIDMEVLELAEKVVVQVDPDLDKIAGLQVPGRVELWLKDGKRYLREIDFVKGHPKNPANFNDCTEKFYECVQLAGKNFQTGKVFELSQLIQELEKLEDIKKLVNLLVV